MGCVLVARGDAVLLNAGYGMADTASGLPNAPGRGFRYSNSGYVLCAKLIEAISGLDCAVFLRGRVLEPAGMTSSGWGRPSREGERPWPSTTTMPEKDTSALQAGIRRER